MEREILFGRMYGYGYMIELYNTDESKGLKGIEYPQGDITFEFDLKLERSKFESTELEDITDSCTPILWNYKVHRCDSIGNIENRTMYFGSYSNFQSGMPLGVKETDRRYSVNNSRKY